MNYEYSTDVGCLVFQYLLGGTEEHEGLVRLIGPPAGNCQQSSGRFPLFEPFVVRVKPKAVTTSKVALRMLCDSG